MVLERVLGVAAPLEGCALLLGEHQGRTLWLRQIWPCCNSWEPASERDHRFALDPREQLLAQRWGRARGLAVLGSAHSHPSSAAIPSPTDLRLCVGPTLMVIRSGLTAALSQDCNGVRPAPLRAWWLPDNADGASDADPAPAAVTELHITIDSGPPAQGPRHLGE